MDLVERLRMPCSSNDALRQREEAAAEIERLHAECVHVYSEYDLVITQRDELLAALNLVMVGGNHLANVLIGRLGGGFAAKFPPDLDHESALQMLGATDTHEVWCCWAAIMTARAAVANQDANSKVKG